MIDCSSTVIQKPLKMIKQLKFILSPSIVVIIILGAFVLFYPFSKTEAQIDVNSQYVAYAYETISVSSSAIGFTANLRSPAGQQSARAVQCTLETVTIRYRFDSGNPTTSDGHLVAINTTFTLYGQDNIRNWRGISTAGAAPLRCTYMR
jgi:hypothetical protein